VTRSQARTGLFIWFIRESREHIPESKSGKESEGGSTMKKLGLVALRVWLSALLVILSSMVSIIFTMGTITHAAEFFCYSGNVTCLIAAINEANGMPGEHVINLEPGSYTLQAVDNGQPFFGNGLPVITNSIRIHATTEDLPTVIERDLNAPQFNIFEVSALGKLTLDGVTVQRGRAAILNSGITSLEDSVIRNSVTDFFGAIDNGGTLRVIRSVISDNLGGHMGGGIHNTAGGNVLVENSTIARNGSADGGGIFNRGSLILKNSAIVFNITDCCTSGGGIFNDGGSVEVVNSTIAKNIAAGEPFGGGGGIASFGGWISITNSTIRENSAGSPSGFPIAQRGGGILNSGGTVRIQNTIIAGNTVFSLAQNGPECSGSIANLGNNLVGDPSGCDINLQPSDLTGDPGLGPLIEIGEDDAPGKAFYPVLPGSVAINSANPAACPKKDQLGNPRVGTCDIGSIEFQERMMVSVDVRPRSDANRINPNSTKNINVAIFSVTGFDATTVDQNTVRFGVTGGEAAPIHVGRRDVNGDGRLDMVVRFEIQDTGIKCGDASASLTGQTSNGVSFIGSSPIKTVQCKAER
jgi:hypothetical protein